MADTLAEINEVDFLEDRNTIRQEARKALEKLLTEETKIDAAARQKIASQRKIIVEGSQEWDILYASITTMRSRSWGFDGLGLGPPPPRENCQRLKRYLSLDQS